MNLIKKGTVSDAIEKYLNTQEYRKKIANKKTKRQYSYQLRRLVSTVLDSGQVAGNIPIRKLNVAKCQQVYYDKLEKNPWGFVERAKVAPRNMVWMPEHFKQFLTTAFSVAKWRNIGLLVRINVELGQRIEDIRLSEWHNYNLDEKLYMREVIQKTKERIPGIPLSDSLVQMLLDQKEDYGFQKYVVPHPYMRSPYSEQNISRVFRQIMEEAGLPKELQLRDIRRTVLTDLANHGATDTEIMAYSGHKSRESLMPYVCISTHQARNAADKRNFSMDDDEWT